MKAFFILAVCGLFAAAQAGIKISAFNIQVFGVSKMDKPDVVSELVDIIRRYDMVAIQEIRNSDGTAIVELLEEVNSGQTAANQYVMSVGPRVGRTSSKEQYCYMYKSSKMTLSKTYTYTDTGDKFEREPYQALFDISGVGTIGFSVLHAKPDDAVAEMNLMDNVYDDMTTQFSDAAGYILMGDFNADCSYASSTELANLDLRTDSAFTWLIGDSIDTTVSTTNCAYDRFVVDSGANAKIKANTAKIYDYQTAKSLSYEEAKDVSDHWPIELEFN